MKDCVSQSFRFFCEKVRSFAFFEARKRKKEEENVFGEKVIRVINAFVRSAEDIDNLLRKKLDEYQSDRSDEQRNYTGYRIFTHKFSYLFRFRTGTVAFFHIFYTSKTN